MEYRLTAHEAVRLFDIWRRELDGAPEARAVENGQIRLDSVASPTHSARGQRTQHAMDGALVIVWYRAANPATARAVREASVATELMGLPRQLYTGKLIDILRGSDGTVYFKLRAIERIDETTHQPAFRSFNPSKGGLIEMVINPSAATVAASAARMQAAAQDVPVAAIQATRRHSNGVQTPAGELR
jgi:hypothetical protein